MAAIRARCDMVRQRRLVLPPALLVLLVSLTATQPGAQAREWTGCYDLEIGLWSRPMAADSLSFTPPPGIQLDTLAIEGGRSPDSPRYRSVLRRDRSPAFTSTLPGDRRAPAPP